MKQQLNPKLKSYGGESKQHLIVLYSYSYIICHETDKLGSRGLMIHNIFLSLIPSLTIVCLLRKFL